jgi:hypothetical protein
MCPNIKNFSLAECSASLLGVNKFTVKQSPSNQQENVNVLFIQKHQEFPDYYTTYAWQKFCDISYVGMGYDDEDIGYWFDANELIDMSYQKINKFLDDM